MTKIHKPIVTTATATLRHTLLAATLGAVIGIAATVASLQYIAPAQAANENAMFNGCKLPDVNGAVTIFTMRDDRLECGRYR